MAEKRSLIPFDEAPDGYGMLCPDSGPALVGNGAIDWHCCQCGSPLLEGMHERQILNLLVRCYTCNTVTATPQREAGEPLARAVVFPPGRYRLRTQVIEKPVMLVGIQAWEDYQHETGLEPSSEASRHTLGYAEINAGFLRNLASEATDLLGERFAHLKAADERGRSSPTPPARRHRLIELIDDAIVIASDLDQGGRSVHADPISELYACVSLFKRWRHHPAYAYLLKTLVDGSEVQHTIMVLAVASYLADAGNGVGIVFRQSNQRIPDLWVMPSVTERLNLEVKTPTELRGPRHTTITRHDAEKLIAHYLKKAASGGGGQLDPRHPATLVIGGFHLDPRSLDILADAAARVLATQSSRKKHLAALLIMDLTYQIIRVIDPVAGFTNATFQSMLLAKLIKHKGYQGSLTIQNHTAAWTTWGSRSNPRSQA